MSHRRKLIGVEQQNVKYSNFRKKEESPSDEDKYTGAATTAGQSQRFYLGTAEDDFKQRAVKTTKKFLENKSCSNGTSLSKYVYEIKEKYDIASNLKWFITKELTLLHQYFEEMCIKRMFYVVPA